MDKKIEKDNVPTINVSFEGKRLQIAVEDKPCLLFTFFKDDSKFERYEELPVFDVNDVDTFNIVTQDSSLVNTVFENELIRQWLTMNGLVEFINQNLSYITDSGTYYIHKVGDYKMVQFLKYYEGEMDMLNVYFDRNISDDDILSDCVRHEDSPEPFTRSFLQVGYPVLRKGGTPFTIDFHKNDWYFSLEYSKDVCTGSPVLSKRDNIFRKIIYDTGYSVSFSDSGIPLIASEKFEMFQKNDKKDIEEIHSAFINRIMMSLLLHSQYTSFYNTYSKTKADENTSDSQSFALNDIEGEVAKRFVDVPMSKRTSQEFLKRQFDSAVVKYDVYPENVKGNIKSIKQVYVRSENPSVNDGFIIRAEYTGKRYIFFKIDDIFTQGKEEYVEEMLYETLEYVRQFSRILKGGGR